MSIRLNVAAGLIAAGAALLPPSAAAQTKLLRFPDIAGDRVAFCYAGDIWTAPAKGGGEALAEGFESGAVMYINKPFTANKLLTIVNTMLEQVEGQ